MKKTSENHTVSSDSRKKRSLFKQAKHEFSKIRKKILKQLAQSKNSGSLIGVHAPALGEGPVISSVEDIYSSGNDEIVILKWFDFGSHIHSQTHLSLDEIIEVSPAAKSSRQPHFSCG